MSLLFYFLFLYYTYIHYTGTLHTCNISYIIVDSLTYIRGYKWKFMKDNKIGYNSLYSTCSISSLYTPCAWKYITRMFSTNSLHSCMYNMYIIPLPSPSFSLHTIGTWDEYSNETNSIRRTNKKIQHGAVFAGHLLYAITLFSHYVTKPSWLVVCMCYLYVVVVDISIVE